MDSLERSILLASSRGHEDVSRSIEAYDAYSGVNIGLEGFLGAMGNKVTTSIDNLKYKGNMDKATISERKILTNDRLDKLRAWIETKAASKSDTELDVSGLKNWLKTSLDSWRYYYLLNDGIYNSIVKGIRSGTKTVLDDRFNADIKARRDVQSILEGVSEISGFVSLVDDFQEKYNEVMELYMSKAENATTIAMNTLTGAVSDFVKDIKHIISLHN